MEESFQFSKLIKIEDNTNMMGSMVARTPPTWLPSKLAKLCLPPLFSMHGRLPGNERGEIEA